MKRISLSISLFTVLAILPIGIFAQQDPFQGCNFVLEDTACKSYFGFPEFRVQSIIGVAESYNDYYRYGIHLSYRAGLTEVTFYGIKPNSDYINTFIGKPSKNFDWSASPEEVISKYRKPLGERTQKFKEYALTEFYYDGHYTTGFGIKMGFMDNKLAYITLGASKSDLENAKSFGNQPKTAQEWFNLGNTQASEKKIDEAIKSYSECIRLNSEMPACLANRGNIYLSLDKYAEAIEDSTKAIKFDPKLALAFAVRGAAYKRIKDFKAAYADLEWATKLDPKYFDAFFNKAFVAMELKDYKNAVPTLERALELAVPTGAVNRWIQKNLVIAYDGLGNSVKADAYHQELLKCCFDDEETISLESRNQSLVADWRQIENLKKQSNQLENEDFQRRNSDEFLALADEDTRSSENTRVSIKSEFKYDNGNKVRKRAILSGIVKILNAAIEQREARIVKMENYLADGWLSPKVRPQAIIILDKIKDLHKVTKSERDQRQSDIISLK